MSISKRAQPVEPQQHVKQKGVDSELSSEAIARLAGFFDVLIQMDLAQQVKAEIRSNRDEKESKDKLNENK